MEGRRGHASAPEEKIHHEGTKGTKENTKKSLLPFVAVFVPFVPSW
jgi:hypothetical protein